MKRTRSRLGPRSCAALLALAAGCSGATAEAAAAASVKISVPRTIRQHQAFKITTTGTYAQTELTGIAYLVSFIQFTSKPCLATGAAEFSQRNLNPYFNGDEIQSPFSQVQHNKASGQLGGRRVCVYLYPQEVGPTDKVTPIAKASALYTVVKAPKKK
jgi:hypothetical protein